MNIIPREHRLLAAFGFIVGIYILITSGLGGLLVANFPSPDPRPSPGIIGNTIAFMIGGVILSGIRLFYPLALHAGEFRHGIYALIQLPLVLGVVIVAALCTAASRKKPRTVFLTGILTYMVTMLATNDLAFAFQVDHSNDFPIATALDKLDWRDKPTEKDVRRVAGEPIAEGRFASVDTVLPRYVKESMDEWKQKEAYILAYFESDKWGRKSTHYVMFNPDTRQRFSVVTINTPIPQDEWPNKAVNSMATRVTPPAEQEARHGQP